MADANTPYSDLMNQVAPVRPLTLTAPPPNLALPAGYANPIPPGTRVIPPTPPAVPVSQPAAPNVTPQLDAQTARANAFVNNLPTYTPAPVAVTPTPSVAVAATPRPAAGGGAGRFTDPANAIQTGYNQQVNYANTMAGLIQNLAAQGNPNNYSFRLAHLANALTGGNFAQVQGQGVDALNQSIAGVTSAGIYGGAQMYGADQGLAGHLAEVGEQHYQAGTSSIPTGTVIGTDPITHMAVPLTTYGGRPAAIGGMPTAYNAQAPVPKAKPVEGATSADKYGNPAIYKNGQWVPAGR